MHQDMGLSWWAAIMLGTLALRTSLTLPVAVYQQKAIGKMINLAPMIQSWAETLKVSVAKETNRSKPDFAGYQKELDKQVKKKKTGV
jgi:inner membrane protein COX18